MAQANAAARDDDEVTARKVARECFDSAGRNVKEAAKIMRGKMRRDSSLLRMLTEEFISISCSDLTRAIVRDERARSWMPPNYDPGQHGDRVIILAASNATSLLDHFRLPGGKLLGDATKTEVIGAADWWGKAASNMAHKERFLRQIAALMTAERRTVRQQLSEDAVRGIQRETER